MNIITRKEVKKLPKAVRTVRSFGLTMRVLGWLTLVISAIFTIMLVTIIPQLVTETNNQIRKQYTAQDFSYVTYEEFYTGLLGGRFLPETGEETALVHRAQQLSRLGYRGGTYNPFSAVGIVALAFSVAVLLIILGGRIHRLSMSARGVAITAVLLIVFTTLLSIFGSVGLFLLIGVVYAVFVLARVHAYDVWQNNNS